MTDALVDVRRAYRLVQAYQRSVLDLVSLVANRLDIDLFHSWSPRNNHKPTQSGDPLRKWAWDMLPMYNVSFHFGSAPHADLPPLGSRFLECRLVSDYDWAKKGSRGEPDPARFPAVECTSSQLIVFVWWSEQELDSDWRDQVKAMKVDLAAKGGGYALDAGITMLNTTWDLSAMANRNIVEERIAAFLGELEKAKMATVSR